MEKRVGILAIFISDTQSIQKVNSFLSEYSDMILARQGLPLEKRRRAVISLILQGETNEMNALSGKLGKLIGVEAKMLLAKQELFQTESLNPTL